MFATLPPDFRRKVSALVSDLEQKTVSAPNEAAQILSSAFAVLAPHLRVGDVAGDKLAFISLLILTLYFEHRGDWAAMQRELV
jgi:hypothetical protein